MDKKINLQFGLPLSTYRAQRIVKALGVAITELGLCAEATVLYQLQSSIENILDALKERRG